MNELLQGETLSKEEVVQKVEENIVNTIQYSDEKIKRMRKCYISTLIGIVSAVIGIITLLHIIFFSAVPYEQGNITGGELFFQNHSAYDMGMTSEEKLVFINSNKALKKAKSDYSDAIYFIQKNYHLIPFSKYTYKCYIPYCKKNVSEDKRIKEQLEGLKNFLAIYENSVQRKNLFITDNISDDEKEELDMIFIQISFLFIVLGVFLFVLLLCTQVSDCIKYFLYKENTKAVILEIEDFSIKKSRRLVERKLDNDTYVAIPATQDKNVHYFPLSLKRKKQIIISWMVEDIHYRARYPYLQTKESWQIGEEIELHYSKNKPWKYAILDKHMWIMTFIKCIAYIGISVIGIFIFLVSC